MKNLLYCGKLGLKNKHVVIFSFPFPYLDITHSITAGKTGTAHTKGNISVITTA